MEERNELLQTIKLPKNFIKLSSVFPSPMYINQDNSSCSNNESSMRKIDD